MLLTSPLVHEKVWLDKPKYDAAERRYYERLSKTSVPSKTEVSLNCSSNSDVVCSKQELANDEEGNINVVQEGEASESLITGDLKETKPEIAADTCVKGVSPKTPEGNTSKSSTSASKKKNEAKSQPHKGDNSKHDVKSTTQKEETKPEKDSNVSTQQKKESNVCSLPSKAEKQRKHTPSQKADNPSTKNESDEILRSKVQSNAKELEGKLLQALQNSPKIESSITEQMSDVTKIDDIAVTSNTVSVEVTNRLVSLEKENQELTNRMEKMEQRIASLEKALQVATAAAAAAASRPVEKATPAPQKPAPKPSNDDDDDGVDLFGSDSEEEDAEAAKIKEQRLAEYAAKKAKKPVLIAKSNIILDVKPWDDETDMKLLEKEVRKIETDGLVWGASKLVPLAYGIHKLQISCVVEDDKVSVDWLQETIQEIEDYVQSVDIAAFNKV